MKSQGIWIRILSGNPALLFAVLKIYSLLCLYLNFKTTVMIQSFRTFRSGQTVQTQIRLLLEEQSDQGLHCLLFHLHLFDKIP